MPVRTRRRSSERRLRQVVACLGLAVLAAVVAVAPTHAAGSGGDTHRGLQWALDTVGAPDAWTRGTGEGTTIAVVDSGVDLDHEDLAAKIDRHVSCIGAGDDPARCGGSGRDDSGHGTFVAGIAAAATGNGRGIAGVAADARLMAVRVLEHDKSTGGASGTAADVRAGIRWAVDHGADVVNLSLGDDVIISGLLGSSLTSAVEYAWDHGVITVVSAGNTGNDQSLFGGGYRGVPAVVVTATNRSDAPASYASGVQDARWGMAAPGGEGDGAETQITSTFWDPERSDEHHAYGTGTGTSMAAPHVAGAAAVLRSLGLSPRETIDRLLDTAADVGPPGDDSRTGAGRLDLAAATAGFPQQGGARTTTADPRVSTTTVTAAPPGGDGAPRPSDPDELIISGENPGPEGDDGPPRSSPTDPSDDGSNSSVPVDRSAVPPSDGTASRQPSPQDGGSGAALWIALAIVAMFTAPVGLRWLRGRADRSASGDATLG